MRVAPLVALTVALTLACNHPPTSPTSTPPASPAEAPRVSCFLLHELGVGEVRRSPSEGCASRLSPASTFKIPHALAALDSGVLAGPDARFAYDPSWAKSWGSPDVPQSWKRDHTLATAMRSSVVWYFQRVATLLGPEREHAYLAKLDYGNKDSSSGLTTFWLDESLRISPDEQERFMVRLYEDALPVSKAAMKTVREILVQPPGVVVNAVGEHPFDAPWPDGAVVSAKTGMGDDVAWLVGHVRRGDRAWVFVSCAGGSGLDALAAIDLAARSLRDAHVL
jgi:beta-lactamase class D